MVTGELASIYAGVDSQNQDCSVNGPLPTDRSGDSLSPLRMNLVAFDG